MLSFHWTSSDLRNLAVSARLAHLELLVLRESIHIIHNISAACVVLVGNLLVVSLQIPLHLLIAQLLLVEDVLRLGLVVLVYYGSLVLLQRFQLLSNGSGSCSERAV